MKLESRHLAFAGLFIVVTVAMLLPFESEVETSPDTARLHAFIDSLPAGSVMLYSFDHEASSLPEIRPLALAFLRHAFQKDIKVIGLALLPEGTGIGYNLMAQAAREFDKTYGEDYAYLGFRPQFIAAILAMGESLPKTFPEDYLGNQYGELPLMADIDNYDDVSGVLSIADGSMINHWIEYGRSRYGVTVMGAVTAAMVTTYDPYLASGQMHGLVGGLRGAAEYEQLIHIGGSGLRGMLAQTTSHLYVILLIVIGNIIYLRERRAEGRR